MSTVIAGATVAVRVLCDFTARQGDLDRRFMPSPTALQGIAGHGVVTGRREDAYETEITLEGVYQGLTVRGRADGYDARHNRLEEIKTHRGDLTSMPDNQRALHWAQARVYGHLLCASRGLARIDVALVYFNIATQTETMLIESHDAASLAESFAQQCERYMAWAQQEAEHRQTRDAGLVAMTFPHGALRPGQRTLAVAVYRAAREKRCVLAQAPTGIGKTLGTLFPALKACADQGVDKVFYLAAKAPGRALALDAVRRLETSAAIPVRVRTLDLVARSKTCEYPGRACNGEDCPLARGFYDRLPQARAAALVDAGVMDQAHVRRAALAHDVCPYYLSQELVRWSDVVVCDYNYYFDSSAMLYALMMALQWRVTVLVDEAHNLVARARAMYSTALSQTALDAARHAATPVMRKPLDALHKRWNAWNKTVRAELDASPSSGARSDGEPVPPETLCPAIAQTVSTLTEMLDGSPGVDDAVMQFYFDALHFTRLLESFGAHSLFDMAREPVPGTTRLRTSLALRNVVPASFLASRYAGAQSVCLFSGTLDPQAYYLDMLGLPENTSHVDVQSPFRAEQLAVNIVDNVSTRFRDRAASVDRIVAVMARQFAQRPGNYLGFFSSFDYLVQVRDRLAASHPTLSIWSQSAGMGEGARADFLARFESGGAGIGFAVLGGAFGEGVDLPGDRLVGAFIATLGLPQMNPVNARMMQRMQDRFGQGYDYTYLYPGMQKVVQAAGRVIRSETDAGVVYLIDDRYARADVRELLPSWWRPQRMGV